MTMQHAAATAAPPATVSDVIADVVAARGVPTFGIMGNGNAHLVGNLTARGSRFVAARHEMGTVAMADAFYRASGSVAVATTTYGAGFTNALTPLAEARVARIPLVLIVGDAPASGARAFDIDQAQVAAGLGVQTLTVNPATARATAERAFAIAERDSVPVVLAIPYDLATVPASGDSAVDAPLPERETLTMSTQQAEQVARLLVGAERPLIIAGRGAFEAGAAADLRLIGDRIGARFATSVMARNVFDSPWDLGVAGGFAAPEAAELMRSADVVLVAGASLNAFQVRYGTLFRDARAVIQIDALEAATSALVTDYVRSDAAAAAAGVWGAIERLVDSPRRGWRESVPARPVFDKSAAVLTDGRLDPRIFACEIDALLPRERTLVHDGGHFIGWMPQLAYAPDPHAMLLVGTAFQSIGLGFPAAVGAAVARPDRTTVLVTGDGGGLMAISEFDTLIRTARSCVVVVFNDAAYGAEIHQYGARGVDTEAMLIDEVDFAAIGRALGAEGVKVRSLDDLQALHEWLDRGGRGTFVLDLPVSRSVVADYMRESTQPPPAG